MAKQTNKELLASVLKKMNLKMGCYDSQIDKLTKKEASNLMPCLADDYTDVDVHLKGKLYVVEIATVDGEVDLNMLSQDEYISRYGSSRWED